MMEENCLPVEMRELSAVVVVVMVQLHNICTSENATVNLYGKFCDILFSTGYYRTAIQV